MNCPEHLIFTSQHLQIWHIQHADIPRRYISWAEVLNPLRYEIAVGRGPGQYLIINKDACWNRAASNLRWKLWGRRVLERKNRR